MKTDFVMATLEPVTPALAQAFDPVQITFPDGAGNTYRLQRVLDGSQPDAAGLPGAVWTGVLPQAHWSGPVRNQMAVSTWISVPTSDLVTYLAPALLAKLLETYTTLGSDGALGTLALRVTDAQRDQLMNGLRTRRWCLRQLSHALGTYTAISGTSTGFYATFRPTEIPQAFAVTDPPAPRWLGAEWMAGFVLARAGFALPFKLALHLLQHPLEPRHVDDRGVPDYFYHADDIARVAMAAEQGLRHVGLSLVRQAQALKSERAGFTARHRDAPNAASSWQGLTLVRPAAV